MDNIDAQFKLRIFWFAALVLVLIHLLLLFSEYNEEGDKHRYLSKLVLDKTAEKAHRTIGAWFASDKIIAEMVAQQLQEIARQPDSKDELKSWITRTNALLGEGMEAGIIAIYDSESRPVVLSERIKGMTQLPEPLLNKLVTNSREDYAWELISHPENQTATIIGVKQLAGEGGERHFLVMAFPLNHDIRAYREETTAVFIVNQFDQGFALELADSPPVQFALPPSIVRSTEPPDANSIPLFNLAGNIRVEQKREFDLGYFTLSSQPGKRYRISKQPMTNPQWELLLFVDAEEAFQGLNDEVLEGVSKSLLILLGIAVAYSLLRYHLKVTELTFIDSLTGLYNRKHLTKFIPEFFAMHDRGSIQSIGAIAIDIDKFKLVNDNYGHDVGDETLKILSQILKSNCRASDRIYRMGGEEFTVICFGDDMQGLCTLGERLRVAVESNQPVRKFLPNGFTISAGLVLREAGESFESFYKRADVLLYQAKETGRNRIEFQPLTTET